MSVRKNQWDTHVRFLMLLSLPGVAQPGYGKREPEEPVNMDVDVVTLVVSQHKYWSNEDA